MLKPYMGIYILLFLAVKYLFTTDNKDLTRPFGGDKYKNDKYAKNILNEGVTTYWGKPSINDDIQKMLDKVEWLGESYQREVTWRRSMISAILVSLIIILTLGKKKYIQNVRWIFMFILVLFISNYFQGQFYNYHINDRRRNFIKKNIVKIKKRLGLNIENSIDNIKN